MFLELEWGALYKIDMYTGALLVSALYIKRAERERERERENLVAAWGFILNGHSSTRRSCAAVMTTRPTLTDKFHITEKERMKGAGSEPWGGGGRGWG